ncbi:MAG: barstar family protein [Burkholderiales bacterium]|nr:barstar family protein [Burkholderiales bacterium]
MNTPHFSAQANGIYRMPRQGVTADTTGLLRVAADLGRARDKKAVLGVIAAAFAVPDSFGGNWDALNDALQDLSWLPARQNGIVLLLSGTAGFSGAAPEDFALLLEILADAASYWRGKKRVFVVFCDAAGLPEFPPS